MRLLIKSINDLANYDSKRPILRPTENIPPEEQELNSLNPARQWWRYASITVYLQNE